MKKYELTTPQKNIWNLQKYYENTSISNLCGAVFYDGKCKIENLKKALNKEIELQEGLRLRFCYDGDTVKQYVADYVPEDFYCLKFNSMAELDEYAQKIAVTPMKMIDSKMYSFEIFEVKGTIGVLLCANHMITDAWSFSLLAKEVYEKSLSCANEEQIDQKVNSYFDFAESEKEYFLSKKYSKDEAYWQNVFSQSPRISYIKNETNPAKFPSASRLTKILDKDFTHKIDIWCKANNISQAVLFEAAIMIYLRKINTENNEVSIGIPILNRSIKDKTVVGMFISTTVLKLNISEDSSAISLCNDLTNAHMQLFRHQKYPYSNIADMVHNKFKYSDSLYNVMVSFQNAATKIGAHTKWYSNGYSEIPFTFHVDNRDSSEGYTVTIDYQTEFFKSREEIELLYERIVYIIDQIIERPDNIISEINIIPEKEYQKLIYNFNDTTVDYPREKCVHELFREQVLKTPDKVAIITSVNVLTYKQVNEQANRIANSLISKGIKPGDIVAFRLKRQSYVISLIIGIIKCGAAFLPIDYNCPKQRIEYMLVDSRAKLYITEDVIKYFLKGNENDANIVIKSSDSFCCIYTSGSTGNPKGVILTHRNVINHFVKNEYTELISTCSMGICLSNVVFDMFINDIFSSLLFGLSLYLTDEKEVVSADAIAQKIIENNVDILVCTPTRFKSFLDNHKFATAIFRIKVLVFGGEILSDELCSIISMYSNAFIINGYGPTETTMVSTYGKITKGDITIGKPIANTQIYILDKNRKPLPIGVAGELCISGDGVGKGYLNRPELTAEKFISNPFIEGKTMYCTGDLARFRTDGELEYLGRIDTQVKIRGLRIELGEIESVMGSFPGIGLCAVTDKRDENNRQYLVGYYTSDCEIDEKALRYHLSAKLPKYMIPNYFVHLDGMPMTASGKTDRKNLPLPDFTQSKNEYVAPKTDAEMKLCSLLAQLLGMEKAGVTDDFFEIGGDSLKAIEFIAKAHNLGIEIALQDVFDYPTVQELCRNLTKGTEKETLYRQSDFKRYEEILSRNVLDETLVWKKKSLGNILLTGVTGFLGAHILDAFMSEESGLAYCLVRGGESKLKDTLKYFFDNQYDSEIGKRIIPVAGDISNEFFAEDIPNNIQTVIHTAATVKHYGSYEYFYKVNVQGTKNVAEFAKKAKAKMIHISTLSVGGNGLADTFDETCLFINQPLKNVYIRSKFEAETAVLDAMLDGLDAKIIRVGNLTNRWSDFKFQPNYQSNAFLTRIKAALEFGRLPDYLMPLYVEFSPIDETAEGVIKIAQYADTQTVFHLNSNKPIYFTRLLEVLEKLNIPMKIVSGEKFNSLLQDYAKKSETEYIYEAFQNDMDEKGNLVYDSNIHIENDFTVWFLKKLGFEWNEIDREYIRGYVEYFRKIGYLKV